MYHNCKAHDSISFCSCTEKLLTANEFKAVYKATLRARRKWRLIGIELEMSLEDLDDIQGKHGADFHQCLEQMLRGWLNRPTLQPTWKSLSSALKGEMVQEEALANKVDKMWISEVGHLGA